MMSMKAAIEKLQKLLDLILVVEPNFLKKQEKNKSTVIRNYGQVFSSSNIKQLTEHKFRDFLKYEENLHWTGLQRQGSNLCKDMRKLRDTLEILIDETVPLSNRVTRAEKTAYMGKAIITPILQVSFPEKYGIWNEISEETMKNLGIFPNRNKREFGDWYAEINSRLVEISKNLRIDLWTLDTLLYLWGIIEKKLMDLLMHS